MIPKIRKILYTTDLSPNAGYVFRYAVNSALKHDAKLVVFHVVEGLNPAAKALIEPHMNREDLEKINGQKIDYARDRIIKRIDELCKKELGADFNCESLVESIIVLEGYPADEILKNADKQNCEAIIMGSHGKGLLQHSYFGSTCKKVLRRSRKPVFIIPLPEGETDITFHEV